ncbi:type II secretion system protein [Novosphingobium sp.]|uniref:type II secretion system protein n=1 Tax=Novosphingobium sp. TaxID=1874826 RepID=UPI002628D0FD|nr:prepilin-type N-terminal cleavage/methylation domain-containing protein [Novosphingobium sp.]
MQPYARTRRPAGFTLIELLTVIAIIGILAAILIPTIGRVRQTANSAKCVSSLRQIGLATRSYANDNRNQMLMGAGNKLYNSAGADVWSNNIFRYLQSNDTAMASNWPDSLRCPTWVASDHPNANPGTGSSAGRNVGYALISPSPSAKTQRTDRLVLKHGSLPSPSRFLYGAENWNATWFVPGRTDAAVSSSFTVTNDDGLRRHSNKSNYLMLDGSIRALVPEAFLPLYIETLDMLDGK